MRDYRNLFLALLAGILSSMAHPNALYGALDWPGGVIAFLSLVPLFMIREPRPPWNAWWLGFAFGLAYLGVSFIWMTGMKSMYPLGPLAWLILAMWMSCYTALFLWGYHRLLENGLPVWVAAPAYWVLLECFRDWLPGFPWASLGYAHFNNPWMLAVAPVTGVWGLSWMTVLVNVAVYHLVKRTVPRWGGQEPRMAEDSVPKYLHGIRWTLFGIVAVIIIAGSVWEYRGTQRECEASEPVKISALQGNIDQNQPWDAAYQKKTLAAYAGLMAAASEDGANLTVWPETAFPGIFDLDRQISLVVRDWSIRWQMAQLVGTDEVERGPDKTYLYYNSLLLVDEKGDEQGSTSKKHLVPFGEYVPLKDSVLFFVNKIVQRYGGAGWTPGKERKVLSWRACAFGCLICFESLFPRYARELCNRGSNLLVVVSNDAWFGKTAAPAQHAAFSVLRAAENARYLIRAATTGYSCIIGPRGEILSELGLDQAGQLTFPVRPLKRQTIFSRFGNWICWICGFMLFLEIFLPGKAVGGRFERTFKAIGLRDPEKIGKGDE